MKKAMISLIIILLLSVTSVTRAATETYVVKKGDSLSVIGMNLGIKWQKIAEINNIKNPYVIFPDQKLLCSRPDRIRQWERVGGNPYSGSWQWAIDHFQLPEDVKNQVKENIKNNKFKWFVLKSGQNLEQVTFGRNKLWGKTICKWDKTKLYAARDYGHDNYRVIKVLKCKNWAWFIKKEKFPPVVPILSVPKKEEGISSGGVEFPTVPVFSEDAGKKVKNSCGFDLYVGGGIYETDRWLNRNNKDYHHDGWYSWVKARYRPFGFDLTERISACLGIFVFGAIGGGDDEGYNYDWNKWSIGPSLKLMSYKDHWDADFDLGLWGQLVSKGEINSYKSKQVDNISVFSAHLNLYERRAEDKKLFPKTEFNLELTLPHNRSHEHSWNGNILDPDPNNNQVLEISWVQHIYDFEIGQDLLLTPGFNLSYINEDGLANPNFLQFGPRATLTWFDQDILSISAFNYKENIGGDGDQWHWLSGYLSIYGLRSAYKSSQITEPTEKDLCSTCL